ncbi:MAG: 16S rRNA (adenine(1518)-N(6)/adenine(1519)-N(6))-dimethyltransferase [Nitrosomonadaceae bacterium]|nr:16S rRNA (adenine(1518)-N(6)/adenine(1519)-N(6))-dimethyltransferase [Nitrosomonadaceae bacterium]|tara:strand:- start:3149 stop:3916 length:768 start_codon:yes stop_codon:yes gene_type:complete
MRHIPRKRFGQNFLVDPQVVHNILQAILPLRNDILVEIGPGLGALTKPLLDSINHLHVIEIDRDIVSCLTQKYSVEKLTVHSSDALKFNFSTLGKNVRVVGNLPYNISTPILFHLRKFSKNICDMHFMLQKEVVERMVAEPSTSSYGRLSIMLQCHFEMEQLFTVQPESFLPAPKIQSAIVRMIPLNRKMINEDEEDLFSAIVTAAFSKRRKTISNTLQDYLKPEDFDVLEINPRLRAENLSVAQFVAITNFITQ